MRETSKARAAFEAYYALGPDRSLRKLAAQIIRVKGSPTDRRKYSLRQLQEWSAAFGWQARVAERDRQQAEANAEAQRRRIAEIMAEGFAATHERVAALNALAERVLADLRQKNLWLEVDRKLVGVGDNARIFIRKEFNRGGIDALRGLFDDLAKETGGRRSISVQRNLNIDFANLTDEQLARIAAGEDPVVVLADPGAGRTGAPAPSADGAPEAPAGQ